MAVYVCVCGNGKYDTCFVLEFSSEFSENKLKRDLW